MKLAPVKSSNVAAIGYDHIQNVLFIQFKGKPTVYEHHGVSLELYESMMAAESIGSFYAKHVKSKYESRRIEGGSDV